MKVELELTESQVAAIVAAVGGSSPATTAPPPVPAGHVLLPATGHVLPLPAAGDNFWAYLVSSHAAAGGEPGQTGPYRANMALQAQAAAERRPIALLGRDSWPEAVDRCYNPEAYETAEQRAQREADEAAAAAATWVSKPATPTAAPDTTETI